MDKYSIVLLTSSYLPRFIGEETYSKGASREYLIGPEPTWCVDPLDGTVNYTHLFPMFCVSIAVIVDGEATIGVICAPFLHQLFSACKGRGAWLNETQSLPLIRNNPIPAQARPVASSRASGGRIGGIRRMEICIGRSRAL